MYGDGGFFFLKPVGAGAIEPVREYGYHMAPHGLAGYGDATGGTRYSVDDSPLTLPELARFYRRAEAINSEYEYFTGTLRFSTSVMNDFLRMVSSARGSATSAEVNDAKKSLDSTYSDPAFRDYISRRLGTGKIRALPYRFSSLPADIINSDIGSTWLADYVGPRVEAQRARSGTSSTTTPSSTDTTTSAIAAVVSGVSPRFLPSVSSVSPSGGAGARAGTPTVGVRTGGLSATTPSVSNGLAQPSAGSGPTLGPPAGGIESQPQLSFTPGEVPFVGGTPGDTKEVTTDETPATVAEESFLSKYGLLLVGGVLVTGAVAYYYRDSLGFGSGTEQK